ncbi:hypothetical protein IQ251_04920 [Saccharopolyspora sp. HNM0983]|uniref:Uncharacterized protein n=1 Tax=Saccharopolyspora montiporae TaxID=2781240 RepID=A0A929B9U5_9PSEU|nr:hypothetical protein [Saccharopolyspora sp. HNM0983]MBE9373788.1 hypothetical protein [Saccharopolyspora sp. HNM0983]
MAFQCSATPGMRSASSMLRNTARPASPGRSSWTASFAEVGSRVSDLALALGTDLESWEINPLRVSGATVEALDAVVTGTPGAR